MQCSEKFNETKIRFDNAYCIVMRTGVNCHPMTYFWLGYAHARGKNVIPITTMEPDGRYMDDLAFDIRAQRHMAFDRKIRIT